MAASAALMAVLGLMATFAPVEVVTHFRVTESVRSVTLLVQAVGALYLGFAVVNWMGRGSLIGGIYGRPVALGNFVHFLVAALALGKATAVTQLPGLIVVTAIYAVFAVWFAFVAFMGGKYVTQR